jgi:phenylacetic acid degradation operon negative regulatory protein
LLTLFGEFVHPSGRPVWTSTLVAAMTSLGIEEKSARQALTRTATHDLIESARHGRRVMWSLTDHGRSVLEEGTERIYTFMRRRRPWDQRWLVLSVPIPETRRQLRHRLGTRLTWLGLGSPTPGLWVSPDASRGDAVIAVLEELGLTEHAFAWTGPSAVTGREAQLLAAAWDLEAVAKEYLAFLDEFEGRTTDNDEEAFIAQVQMVQAWRRFPLIDPDLPAELLGPDWPGPRAANVFHDRHARWHRAAHAAWENFERS